MKLYLAIFIGLLVLGGIVTAGILSEKIISLTKETQYPTIEEVEKMIVECQLKIDIANKISQEGVYSNPSCNMQELLALKAKVEDLKGKNEVEEIIVKEEIPANIDEKIFQCQESLVKRDYYLNLRNNPKKAITYAEWEAYTQLAMLYDCSDKLARWQELKK